MYFWWVLVSIRLLWEGGRNVKQLCEVGLTLSQLCLKIAPAIAEHWLGVDFKYCRIMELSSRHIIDWILNAVASFSSTEVKIRWQWWAVWLHQPGWISTPTTPGLPPPRMDKPSISHSAARISPPENLQILRCIFAKILSTARNVGLQAFLLAFRNAIREWGRGNSVWIASSLCQPNVFIRGRRLRAWLCHRQIPRLNMSHLPSTFPIESAVSYFHFVNVKIVCCVIVLNGGQCEAVLNISPDFVSCGKLVMSTLWLKLCIIYVVYIAGNSVYVVCIAGNCCVYVLCILWARGRLMCLSKHVEGSSRSPTFHLTDPASGQMIFTSNLASV